MKQFPDFDLLRRNTFRMKVRCAMYLEIESEEELKSLDWNALPQPVMVLGGGSNLLFTKDFPGTVLHVGISFIRTEEIPGHPSTGPSTSSGTDSGAAGNDVLVTCGAATLFDDFCAWAAAEGLWGPENLSLIPGECGASAVQNIGAYGVEVKDILADIRAWDRVEGRFVNIDPATCGYGYRKSNFKTVWKGRYVITAVTYRLSKAPIPRLEYKGLKAKVEGMASTLAIRNAVIAIRREKLPEPEEIGSAGSFFCNPVVPQEVFERVMAIAQKENGPDVKVPHFVQEDGIKIPAAWLIDQCGFKGAVNGGAQVWQNQPLVIVNASGSASPEEIIGLENRIIGAIAEKYGITLKPEVEHV